MIDAIKGTYTFKRYAECIDLCNQMPEQDMQDIPKKCSFLLYRGKSFYHIYQKEQNHFQQVSSTLSKKEFYLKQKSIYEKAGEVIINLGSLLDINLQSFIDDEMRMFLDISMIDVACQVNNLKEYSRCLLCLKKAELCKSHLCPDSILRAFASGLQNTKNKRLFNLSFFKDGKTTSPHGVTMWLFCGKCETILSRDGETHFIPKFFRHIYNTDNPQQSQGEISILYEQWLYRFCIGLLFRGLINEAIASFLNSAKIHHIFSLSRKLVLTEGDLSAAPHNPDIYLLISPSVPTVSAGFIGHIYHAPFLFALTDLDLQTGSNITPRACQFFLARIGILNFLLFFDDNIVTKSLLPAKAKITISRGEFVVPSEVKRPCIIPHGINQILEGLATATYRNFMESSVTTMWGLKLSHEDAASPPTKQAVTYMTHGAIDDDMKKTLLTSYSLSSPQILDMLPPGFHIEHSNGLVSLPDGHQMLFHGDFEIEMKGSEPFQITLFLAAGNLPSTSFALENSYVIFHRYQPGLDVTLSFFVNPDTFTALKYLPDPNPKAMLHQIGNELTVKALTETLLPELMELRGLKSYHTVVHRATLQRLGIELTIMYHNLAFFQR